MCKWTQLEALNNEIMCANIKFKYEKSSDLYLVRDKAGEGGGYSIISSWNLEKLLLLTNICMLSLIIWKKMS